MRPIATDGVAWSVCLCLTIVNGAKTTELMEMLFGVWTQVGKRKHVRWGAHWRTLANTTELSMWGSDAAFCQITLTTCLSYHSK